MKKHNLNRLYDVLADNPATPWGKSSCSHEFMVINNVVICLFKHADYDKPFKGIAKLDPNDEFSLATGKKWATTRAHMKFQKRRLRDLRKQLVVLKEIVELEEKNEKQYVVALVNLDSTLKRLHTEAEVI
jgi:hypothetical protein